MDTVTEAINWWKEGIAPLPIWPGTKKPALKSWQEYQTCLPSLNEMIRWFREDRSLAIVTGWQNLVVVDFDCQDWFFTWYELFPLATRMVATGRGVHVYLYVEEPVKPGKFFGGDIKAAGGYVLVPPSIHPSGSTYQLLVDQPILRVKRLADVFPAGGLQEPRETITQYKEVDRPQMQALQAAGDPWGNAAYGGMDLIYKIKAKYSIFDFVSPVEVKKPDHWYLARCPFHDDHNPSMWMDAKHGLCGCYAGCTPKPLDVINLYARLHGLANTEAINELAARAI